MPSMLRSAMVTGVPATTTSVTDRGTPAAALETASVVDEELQATSRLQAIIGRRNFFMVEVLSGDRTL
ncbi:MAG: hypothetical protein IPP26_14495 [Flavobacteriales bacterium]|nr:hypothetical protein [Flavobacteriales bacterium]